MSLAPGARVAERYTVVRPIGRGGLATVWLVRHDALQTLHALKVLTMGSDALYARMLHEGRIQAGLQHPNVLPVTDLVRVAGAIGLILRYVPGPSLRALLADPQPLGLDEAHALFRGIAAGVGAAHRSDVVHRDLKPANVLLEIEDGRVVPKVTDFGLAKALATGLSGGDAHATRSGAMLGTPAYMAPEQVRDASKVDARADLFALGALGYELVTGVRAFEGDDIVETLGRVKAVRYTPVRACRADVPAGMVEAIEAALVADPAGRIGSVSEMLALWCREGSPEPEAGFARRVVDLGERSESGGPRSPAWDSGSQSTWQESKPPAAVQAASAVPAVRRGLPWWGQIVAGGALFAAGVGVAVRWTEVPPVPPTPPEAAPQPLIPEVSALPIPAPPPPLPAPAPPPPPAPQVAPPAAPPAPAPAGTPGLLSPAAAEVAQVLGTMTTDLSADGMAGREDLAWLRETLPDRIEAISARAQAFAEANPGTDAEIQALYQEGHAWYIAFGFYRWARPPLNSEGEERTAWETAIEAELGPAADRARAEARRVFERLADREHPAAGSSTLPAIARQMLAAMDRDSPR